VLTFDLVNSKGLTDDEKTLLQTKIATKLTQEGILILTSEEDRSQLKNKEKVIKKCFKLLENALFVPKERKETKIPRAVKEKRLNAKKVMSVLKQNRKKPNF
jgi:ribosome-associated protein